jgi:hypothetical protein
MTLDFFFNSVTVMACLVLVSFWLPPLEENRINILCISLICHCLCLTNLWWKMKNSGDKNPLIGKETFVDFIISRSIISFDTVLDASKSALGIFLF